jgi:methylthioribose-1-phosphate isomerase
MSFDVTSACLISAIATEKELLVKRGGAEELVMQE